MARYASQVHSNPQPATVALFLNTRLPPFNRLDVRRALNFAADRAAAVNAVGGSNVARATCQICDPRIDRQVERALAEQAAQPDIARRAWERVDSQTVDRAPLVSLVNPKVIDVLSKRVGNYEYSPAGLGMLIDQLWVR